MICKRMNCKKESPILCNCSQASNWLEGSRTAPELPPPSLSLDYSSNFLLFFNFKFWNSIEPLLKYHIPLFHGALLQIFIFFKFSNIWICNFLVTPELPPPSLFLDPYSIVQFASLIPFWTPKNNKSSIFLHFLDCPLMSKLTILGLIRTNVEKIQSFTFTDVFFFSFI